MNNAKRIAFVLGGMSFGGAERVISILANHYAKKGWQADIITLLKPDCDFALDPSIRHIHLGGQVKSRALRAPAWLLGLRSYIAKEQPNAIVSFAARINLLTLGASLFAKRPQIVISERNDPMHDTRTAVVRKLTEILYPRADAIVFQTARAMRCFSDTVQKKGRIIANPVTPNLPKATMQSERIVAVGKLMHQKNHAILVRAFSKIAGEYPDYTLHIYGDGPLRVDLETLIAEKKLENRVFLEGWKSNVAGEIADAALFVLPSDYEGLSNALMEAVAMGLPCISTDCAGAVEMIKDGVSGLITPVGNEAALENAMRKMMDDAAFAKSCAENAREHAKSFETGNIIALWEQAIED